MRTIRWLGQTIDNACMQACNVQYGASSKKPDPAALIACFVTQCSGSQTAPPTVVPPPGFTLPAGMTFPGGFTIPAGWTLPAGLPLPPGNLPGGTLPPGWTLPTSIIPPGFTLPQNWTLPANWTLPGPLTLPVPLTVPAGVPVPPNLPSVPPPAPVQPTLPPAQTAPEKKDNTVLWVVGGVAAVGLITVLAMSSKSIGQLEENPGRNPRPRSGYAYETSVPVNGSWIDHPNDDWDTVVISPSRNYTYVGKRSIDGSMVYVWRRNGTRIHIAQVAFGS